MTYDIVSYQLGPMENLSYLLIDKRRKDTVLFDAGWQADKIIDIIKNNDLTLRMIALTHSHYDHSNAVSHILEYFDVPVLISQEELDFWQEINIKKEQTQIIHDNDIVSLGDTKIKVITTPGHTPGGICYLASSHLVTGDTLFFDNAGRTDLPGGDADVLTKSLLKLKKMIPDDIVLCPGHTYGDGSNNTFGGQKKTNPYLVN
jgi:hydroxyacylglutathione hydrolase